MIGYELSREEQEDYRITSPNGFPLPYPNNAFKFWDIRAPVGHDIEVFIDSFEIQRGADYLHIGSGVESFGNRSIFPGKWMHLTGRESDIYGRNYFVFNTSSVKLIFTSDWRGTDSGFVIRCSARDQRQTRVTFGRKFPSL